MAARYPNKDFLFPSSAQISGKISCSEIDPEINYRKANIICRSNRYNFNGQTIASSSGYTITLAGDFDNKLDTKNGFILTNKLEFLDSPGEWYYEDITSTLYIWTPNGDSPSNYTIRATVYSNNIIIKNKNYVIIQNLNLNHASVASIYQTNSNYITYDNCDIEYPNVYGIRIAGGSQSNTTINNNKIVGSSSDGLSVFCAKAIVSNNYINKIGLFSSIGVESPESNIAIKCVGDSCIIKNNIIEDIGYNGISFLGTNIIIENNFINFTNVDTDDGGGIYTYQGEKGHLGIFGLNYQKQHHIKCVW